MLALLPGIGLGLSPLPCYTNCIFAPSLSKELGWWIDRITVALTVTTLMLMWAGQLVGVLAKRWSAR